MTFKNNDFLCFAAFNGYDWATFTLDEDGKDSPFELIYKINYAWRRKDAANRRKSAKTIYAVYVNKEKQDDIDAKIIERGKNELHSWRPEYNHRYKLEDLTSYKKNIIDLSWRCSGLYPNYKYISVSIFGSFSYNLKEEINPNDTSKAREEIFKNCFDKSGFFLLKVRESLARRAVALKNQRQFDYYKSIDKASYIGELKKSMFNCEELLKNLTTVENVKIYGTKKIDQLLSCIKHHQKVIDNIDNYKNLDGLSAAIKEVTNEYIIILTQFKNSVYSWANVDCYTLNDNKVVARWSWVAERGYIDCCDAVSC